jgi:hypothetical protein
MNHRERIEQARLFEEQLFEARNALFVANSVKRIKFLQSKIRYLTERSKAFA